MAEESPITVNPFPVFEEPVADVQESKWGLIDSFPLISFELRRVDEFAVGNASGFWFERNRFSFVSEMTSLEFHVVALIIFVLLCSLIPTGMYGRRPIHSQSLIEEADGPTNSIADYPLKHNSGFAEEGEDDAIQSRNASPDLLDTPRLSGHQ